MPGGSRASSPPAPPREEHRSQGELSMDVGPRSSVGHREKAPSQDSQGGRRGTTTPSSPCNRESRENGQMSPSGRHRPPGACAAPASCGFPQTRLLWTLHLLASELLPNTQQHRGICILGPPKPSMTGGGFQQRPTNPFSLSGPRNQSRPRPAGPAPPSGSRGGSGLLVLLATPGCLGLVDTSPQPLPRLSHGHPSACGPNYLLIKTHITLG